MNKLLNELSQKAEDYADDTDLPWLATYTERLAHLIVAEAVRIGSQSALRIGQVSFLNDHSTLPVFPATQIKEHFGVKE
jgi:hypothetical protein